MDRVRLSSPTPAGPHRRRVDVGFVVAVAWLSVAVVGTVLWGRALGIRGWLWVGLHHVLCVVGCTHELRRAWQRYQTRG